MFAQFRYLDGPKAGETKVVGNDFATIGRHPGSDVGFDELGGLEVSVRHAAVFKQGGGFLIRDLGSTNGTYLNGQRVRGDRPLEPADRIQLGPSGPTLEFSTVATLPLAARSAPAPIPGPPPPSTEIYRPRARTTERVLRADPPSPPRRPWRWMVGVVIVVGGLAASVVGWRARETRGRLEQRRIVFLGRIDDHLNGLRQAGTTAGGLGAALEAARSNAGQLRSQVTAATSLTAGGLDSLDRAFNSTAAADENLLGTVALDPAAVVAAARARSAVVIGEDRFGSTVNGSGVAIARRGDSVWIGVPRRVVFDSAGAAAVRVAVIMNGAKQAHLMGLVGGNDTAAVAVISGIVRSSAAVAAAEIDSISVGSPVVAIGFPFGADSLGEWRKSGPVATSWVGTVAGGGSGQSEIEGYGVDPPLGSAVYTAAGALVGVVVGSAKGRWTVVPLPKVASVLKRATPPSVNQR